MSSPAAVRVVVRIRPDNLPATGSAAAAAASTITAFSPNSLEFKTGEEYAFSSVLGPESTQQEAYEVCTKGLVDEALLGYNTTVLAYGQTSSGKTFTMMGPGESDDENDFGIIPRLAAELFEKLANVSSENNMTSIKVSFVEIYRERLRDLLTVQHTGKGGSVNASSVPELKIREGDSKKVIVEGLTELFINTKEELMSVMRRGNAARSIGSTKMNEDSSRSHSVFTLKVLQQQGSGDLVIESKIQLVDLAGSEQVKRTGAHGDRLEEAKSINLSLSCLGNVVSALAEHSKFIPYRDSKLTRILQDSLGGTAKTCLICTISPHPSNEAETLSTLRFGTRAQKVQNHVVKNIRRSEDELERLLALAEERIRLLEIQLLEQREPEHALLPPAPIPLDASNEALFQRVGELELELQRSKAQAETSALQLEQSVRERSKLDLALSESEHRERTLQIDLDFARQQLDETREQLHNKSAVADNFPEDISALTEKCLKYQILLNESREEVEMLKRSKVDQVWMYLVETQERLKQSEQEKIFLTGELASVKAQVKHKQDHVDEMKWEHAKVKAALKDEVDSFERKLDQVRDEYKRYRQAVEGRIRSGSLPSVAGDLPAPPATTAAVLTSEDGGGTAKDSDATEALARKRNALDTGGEEEEEEQVAEPTRKSRNGLPPQPSTGVDDASFMSIEERD